MLFTSNTLFLSFSVLVRFLFFFVPVQFWADTLLHLLTLWHLFFFFGLCSALFLLKLLARSRNAAAQLLAVWLSWSKIPRSSSKPHHRFNAVSRFGWELGGGWGGIAFLAWSLSPQALNQVIFNLLAYFKNYHSHCSMTWSVTSWKWSPKGSLRNFGCSVDGIQAIQSDTVSGD